MASDVGADGGADNLIDDIGRLSQISNRTSLMTIDAVLRALPRDGQGYAAAAAELRTVARRVVHSTRDLRRQPDRSPLTSFSRSARSGLRRDHAAIIGHDERHRRQVLADAGAADAAAGFDLEQRAMGGALDMPAVPAHEPVGRPVQRRPRMRAGIDVAERPVP